jgi:hypothetical protein
VKSPKLQQSSARVKKVTEPATDGVRVVMATQIPMPALPPHPHVLQPPPYIHQQQPSLYQHMHQQQLSPSHQYMCYYQAYRAAVLAALARMYCGQQPMPLHPSWYASPVTWRQYHHYTHPPSSPYAAPPPYHHSLHHSATANPHQH